MAIDQLIVLIGQGPASPIADLANPQRATVISMRELPLGTSTVCTEFLATLYYNHIWDHVSVFRLRRKHTAAQLPHLTRTC